MNILARFEKHSRLFWIVIGFGLICVVGFLDFLTGYEYAFSLFYLIPISLVTWSAGLRPGVVASLASAFVWIIMDVAAGGAYSQLIIYTWNTLIEGSIFIVVVILLSSLRKAMDRDKKLARTDYLTGAVNSRFFYDLLQMEINRSFRYRHPFTLVYFDIDDFKTVNDCFGHAVGDQVLQTVVDQTRKYLRKTDVIARLGGDEFALLLPETDQEAAQVVLSKFQGGFLPASQLATCPVTLSIGVLTCCELPHGAEEIVRTVDDLMYTVKREGKNSIKYALYQVRAETQSGVVSRQG